MNQLRNQIIYLGLAVTGYACNTQFSFDVHNGSLASAGDGSTADNEARDSGSDAGTFEQCTAGCAVWGQLCAPDWMVCVECNSDSDCPGGAKRRCWVEDHRCVACATDADCATGQHCVSQTGECRPACNYGSTDDVCSSDGEQCGDSDVCVSCEHDSECATNSHAAYCLPGGGYCVACLSDAECSGATLKCDTVSHACVLCKDGRDCASGCCNIAIHSCY